MGIDDRTRLDGGTASHRTAIHRFALLRQLGAGAMGVVYEARDPAIDRRLALKVLRGVADAPEILVRFKREFRLVKAIQHPNVIHLGELFNEDGEWFFTMELLDGTDFLSFVRGGLRERGALPCDEGRLRDALGQLASALEVTHDAGILHRDIKPSNVLVTGTGRVVVLDFGVAKDGRAPPAAATRTTSLVGTPAYMSPEQAISGSTSPATDMYSVGVMLFEALTGVRPFEGNAIDVMSKKQTRLAASPRDVIADVPEDLSRLAMDLLAIDPEQRPTASAMLERLGHRASHVEAREVDGSSRPKRVFVGRRDELATLDAGYAEARAGKPVTIIVRGESGIGKSVLLNHFASELAARWSDVVVLHGRCRENEWIPFKAFDGIMDELAQLLGRVPREAAAILPVHADHLARVFPVFRELVGVQPRLRAPVEDPADSRSRLFTCVREMLARLAERFVPVLVIDDLQWADPDSVALLHELTRPPDAPPVLLLVTSRPDAADVKLGATQGIDLPRLSVEDSISLVHEMEAKDTDPKGPHAVDAELIAREAQGHPMFIAELVRYSAGTRDASVPRLDDALRERLDALEPPSKLVLDLVALAGRPVTLQFLAHATQLHFDEVARRVAALRLQHTLRASGSRGDLIEPYHDRVREVALAEIDPQKLAIHHRRIATALEASDKRDLEALALHWRGAGDQERAFAYASDAAREAVAALAFDHAARLYQILLDSPALPPGEEAPIAARLGEALVDGGHSAAAAAAFHRAARVAARLDALPLLQRAAEQELRAGLIEQGLQTMRNVLTSLRIAPPKAMWLALLSFLFWRAVLRVRGYGFTPRPIDEIQPRQLAVIDVCWSLSFSLSSVDPIRGTDFQTRQLLLALRVGEPTRVARALALETPYLAGPGAASWHRTQRLLDRCEAVANEIGDPMAKGLAAGAGGIAAYLCGRFLESLERMDRGEAALRQVIGVWAEMTRIRRFAIGALSMTGQFRELCARVRAQTKEAQERGDYHTLVNLAIGHSHVAFLVRDEPDVGRATMRAAMARWTNPGFLLEHLYELFAETNTDLYLGDPAAAHARILERWPALRASVLLRIPSARIISLVGRARTWIALAAKDPSRRDLLAEASRLARSIGGKRAHWTWPMGALLRAGVARVEGRAADAEALLRDAEERFGAFGMKYYASAARRARGRLAGGDAGKALIDEAEAAMRAEGIVDVERFASVWAPGL